MSKPKQHIVRAKYPKGNIVYIFYDVTTRRYSGHFFLDKTFSKENSIKTIQETFPPSFDEIGDYKIKLIKEMKTNIEFDYLIPEGGQLIEYEFFQTLAAL